MLFTVVKPQQIFHQFQIYTNTNAPRGFIIEKTPSDGNCLFPSLLLVLSESCNLAAFLRLGACWYEARHQDHFLDQLKKYGVDNYGSAVALFESWCREEVRNNYFYDGKS